MVSDTGLYHGGLKQRASESMPFSRFLQAMRLEAAQSAQHWYLAQVQIPPSCSVNPAHSWPPAIMPSAESCSHTSSQRQHQRCCLEHVLDMSPITVCCRP